MSPEGNVEIVRDLMRAFDRGDTTALLANLDADVELTEWPEGPDSRTYSGHAGALRAFESWFETWEWIRLEATEYDDLGDRVLVCGRTKGKGKGSTVEVAMDAFNLYTLRDGKVTRIEFYTDRDTALRAADLIGAETKEAE